ncbi:DNA polymerase eta [Candida viswanathii]|uniref:DNA polymerase eta n=1 Tax=Candida viswanathii TaxID=5486 RepID=A0A367XNX1_9ASCO|nr:DNA polymerase eta [Candida viswanathii]
MSVRPTDKTTTTPSPPAKPLTATPTTPSQFTYKDLADLLNPAKSHLLPLSTIALVDLNAFFAQVEQIRLGLPDTAPIVCAQWSSIIAVSYRAREFGIGRMDSIESARKKCPGLIVAHAAVYRKGQEYWAYQDNGLPAAKDHKVSLDSYRRESRKILRVILDRFDMVEKASVDECYIDFGKHVHDELMALFPELQLEGEYEERRLPAVPRALPGQLQWEGVVFKSDAEEANQSSQEEPTTIQDWDDVCLLIGSRILMDLRRAIYAELGYTTSAGLSRNKLVSKLAGGFKKPDNQTIIRNASLPRFLSNFELTDVSGMGGKLGDSVVNKLDVPPQYNSMSYIRDHCSMDYLVLELDNDRDLARKVYEIVRGLHATELTNRTEVKSMMSAKNFALGSVKTLNDAYGWIRVFSGDLFNRLVDLDNETMELSLTKLSSRDKGVIKRPKTLTISVVFPSRPKLSRQMRIPALKDLNKMKVAFYENGCLLLREFLEFNTNIGMLNNKPVKDLFMQDPKNVKLMELQLLSLTCSNFDVIDDNSLIENFATKAKNNDSATKELIELNAAAGRAKQEKKQQRKELSADNKEYIARLFKELEDCREVAQRKTLPHSSSKRKSNQMDIFQTVIMPLLKTP